MVAFLSKIDGAPIMQRGTGLKYPLPMLEGMLIMRVDMANCSVADTASTTLSARKLTLQSKNKLSLHL